MIEVRDQSTIEGSVGVQTECGVPMSADSVITVWYDGSCPLCRREISVYQGPRSRQPISWLDMSESHCAIPPGFDRDDLLNRFHVRVLGGGVARGFDVAHLPSWLVGDLRSDHAGETGAVWIYRGVLAVSRDEALRQFAAHHLATELRHLEALRSLVPALRRSKLVVPWRIAGFLTGFIPALFGARAVYATIRALKPLSIRTTKPKLKPWTPLARMASCWRRCEHSSSMNARTATRRLTPWPFPPVES